MENNACCSYDGTELTVDEWLQLQRMKFFDDLSYWMVEPPLSETELSLFGHQHDDDSDDGEDYQSEDWLNYLEQNYR